MGMYLCILGDFNMTEFIWGLNPETPKYASAVVYLNWHRVMTDPDLLSKLEHLYFCVIYHVWKIQSTLLI